MNRNIPMIVCAQAAFFCCAVVMAGWVQAPWFAVSALALTGISLLTLTVVKRERARKWAAATAWICIPVVLFGVPLTPSRIHGLDVYHAAFVWCIAAASALTARRLANGALRTWMKLYAITWALFGNFVWLAASYLQNEQITFYTGLAIGLVLLVLCQRWFRMPDFGIVLSNTMILILIGLPAVDLVTRPTSQLEGRLALANRYYSYQAAKQNPAAFRTWWENYLEQWKLMARDIFVPDPAGVLPLRLKANSNGFLFDSPIHINSKGFRGKEFREEKGNAYRIVTLGESTTFGCTLQPEDRPWPEVLEQMIRERLGNLRPVEVINAGVPAYNLQHNLSRLSAEILPLKPDLIISYHGANGLYLLDAALPKPFGQLAPAYRRRPVKLLADCEYRLKMMRYRRHLDPRRLLDPAGFSNPLTTQYAEAYRQLIRFANTNGIRLVLANYAMAVNSQSDSEAVEFYRTASPSIHWQIRGNAVHTEIVKQLAAQHPEVCFVDTHPNLDGDTEKFIDLGHFTQAGRQQMAETFFAGIEGLLEKDLSEPDPTRVK